MNAKEIEKLQRRLYSRVPLIRRWLQHGAVKSLARDSSPQAVRVLAEAATRSDDDRVRAVALEALRQFASLNNADAQEALCRLVIEDRCPLVRAVVLAAGYALQDDYQLSSYTRAIRLSSKIHVAATILCTSIHHTCGIIVCKQSGFLARWNHAGHRVR